MGKIYGGLLILENWKATKFGKVPMTETQVKFRSYLETDNVNIMTSAKILKTSVKNGPSPFLTDIILHYEVYIT